MNLDPCLDDRGPQSSRYAAFSTYGRKRVNDRFEAEDETEPKPAACPSCNSSAVARIVYGYLLPGMLAEDEVGGGCCFAPETWYCRACEWAW